VVDEVQGDIESRRPERHTDPFGQLVRDSCLHALEQQRQRRAPIDAAASEDLRFHVEGLPVEGSGMRSHLRPLVGTRAALLTTGSGACAESRMPRGLLG
jgi:hypothetical protein